VFAIPLPYFLDAELSSRLQLISSQLGVYFIRFFGVPVYLTGNVIDLGTYKLQVAEACSGLRYLYPLLSLGFLAAYLFQAPLWQRALVFLSAVPITIVMNSFRIGITGLMVDRWGIEQAQGVLHFFEGWVIFIACAAIMAAEIFVLARFGSGKRFSQIFHNPKVFPAVAQDPQWKSRSPGTVPLLACLMVLCAVGVASFNINERHEIVPDRVRFISFPTTLGDWLGHPSLMEADIERTLGVDDYILSDYVNPRNDVVNFYIAYYASQRKGSSPHSPEVCIPGGGWQITKFERMNYKSQSLGINLPLNRVIIARDNGKQLVYYWFVQRGRNIANEYWSKWYLLVDAITKGRTDGALVRLVTPLRANEPEQAADERLQAFIDQLEPRLKSYLPPETAPDIKAVVHDAKDQQS
jgi:exosortase D (VPLPA-CTERM-specific)